MKASKRLTNEEYDALSVQYEKDPPELSGMPGYLTYKREQAIVSELLSPTMANEIIFTVTESKDGGYEAKSVGHSIYTQCEKYDELSEVLRDTVKCHFNETDALPSIHIHMDKDDAT